MVKNQNNNSGIFLAIGAVLVTFGIATVVNSIMNMKTTPHAPISAPVLTQPSPIVEVNAIPELTHADEKKLSTVTLNPPTERDLKVVNTTKKIKPLKLDARRTINLFGAVGDNAHQAAGLIRAMNTESKDPIYLVLYSPGGSVVDGAALISAMQASVAPVYTVCYTFCASMAAMIHQYGNQRYITDRSILMFHPASFRTGGEVDKVASEVAMIQRYINKIEIEVAARMKMSFEQYKKLTAYEYWIDSEDGLKANAADNIVYLIPTGLARTLKSLFDDKKEFIHKKRIDTLQWIY